MATTKTLTPTNKTITLASFTEKPDNRNNVNNDDKLADAVNALNSKLSTVVQSVTVDISGTSLTNVDQGWYYAEKNIDDVPTGFWIIGIAITGNWDADVSIVPHSRRGIILKAPTQRTIGNGRSIIVYYA